MDSWDFIKYFYKIKFNYPSHIVDLLAVSDILYNSCLGYSNTRISRKLHIDVNYVGSVLIEFLGFSGWYDDLIYSPIAIYKQDTRLDRFRVLVYNIDIFLDENTINISYKICKQYYEIKDRIDKYN